MMEAKVGESGVEVMEEDATSSCCQSRPCTPDIGRLKRVIMAQWWMVNDYFCRPKGCSPHHWQLMSIKSERCVTTLNIMILQMKTKLRSKTSGMHACDLMQMHLEKSWIYLALPRPPALDSVRSCLTFM
jgi:hypothetical protein